MSNDMRAACVLADGVRNGEVSARTLVETCLDRIAGDDTLNAFYFVDADAARAGADRVDAAVGAGEDPGPLAGVPVAIKELEDVAGWPSEHASLAYEGHVAAEDHTHVARLRAAGAVLVGKTTSPEFGFVGYTNSKLHGATRNPWNPERTPGGSSGGSAAAVVSGMVPIASASDGGGSIRIPASFSGLPGLKPTFGRIPMGPTLPPIAQITSFGCLSPYIRDVARWLDVCAGPDPTDRLSLPPSGFAYEDRLGATDVAGLRAAWSLDLGFATVHPEVAAATEAAARELAEAAGLQLVDRRVEIDDPGLAWMALGAVDTMRDLGFTYPDRLDELTREVRGGVKGAEKTSLEAVNRSLEARHAIERALAALWADVDILITPATPNTAFGAEGPMPTEIGGEKVVPWMTAAFTIPHNMAGNPAISLPAGFDTDGLPIGLSVAAPHFHEHVLLELATIWEKQRPWPCRATGYAD